MSRYTSILYTLMLLFQTSAVKVHLCKS